MTPAAWVWSRSTTEVIHGSLRRQPVSSSTERTRRVRVSSIPTLLVGAQRTSGRGEQEPVHCPPRQGMIVTLLRVPPPPVTTARVVDYVAGSDHVAREY